MFPYYTPGNTREYKMETLARNELNLHQREPFTNEANWSHRQLRQAGATNFTD